MDSGERSTKSKSKGKVQKAKFKSKIAASSARGRHSADVEVAVLVRRVAVFTILLHFAFCTLPIDLLALHSQDPVV